MTMNTNQHRQARSRRRRKVVAFTLTELLIVLMILGILMAMTMSAVMTAAQEAKISRTRAIISKIDQLITEKYESYKTRPVAIRILPGTSPQQAAAFRLNALRDLMRMEMPDRQSDLLPYDNNPNPVLSGDSAVGMAIPSLTRNYRRRAANAPGWTGQYDSAECLYLILASMRDGEKNALDFFSPSEIGDIDGDGMNEIWDAWGNPIFFIRWAPGYRSDIAPFPVTPQTAGIPDPFDPLRVDRPADNHIALKPLIFSMGPDKLHDLYFGTAVYSLTTPPNDPYVIDGSGYWVGQPLDNLTAPDGVLNHVDNITNHDLEAR